MNGIEEIRYMPFQSGLDLMVDEAERLIEDGIDARNHHLVGGMNHR